MIMQLEVGWYGEHIGTLFQTEEGIRWSPTKARAATVFEPHHLPHLFRYLQPEGWLAKRLGFDGNVCKYIEDGSRFLSNISIMEDISALAGVQLTVDSLTLQVKDCSDSEGVFTGHYAGPSGRFMTEDMQRKIGALWESKLAPRFSGTQMKMPVTLFLDESGPMIKPAEATAFTHILKFPLTGFNQSMPSIEWLGLELAKAAGMNTSDHALVDMPEGMAPALLIERFDIPRAGGSPHKQLLIQDFCNLMNLDPENHKYDTPLERCSDALLEASSDPEADKREFFKRTFFAWIIRDFDMHLKNLSVVKTYDSLTGDVQTRLSPAYDALTTGIYEDNNKENFALPLNGRTQRLATDDFMDFAAHMNIPAEEAAQIMENMAETVAQKVCELYENPPKPIEKNAASMFALRCAATQIIMEIDGLGYQTPDFFDYTFAEQFIQSEREAAAVPKPKITLNPA